MKTLGKPNKNGIWAKPEVQAMLRRIDYSNRELVDWLRENLNWHTSMNAVYLARRRYASPNCL